MSQDNKNLYDYVTPKSGNEETGIFNIKGRISRDSFILRFMFALGIYGISCIIYITTFQKGLGNRFDYNYDTFHTIILRTLLPAFVLIQGAKRMHDVNLSGWYFLIPFYNLYLSFLPGTKGKNNFGIDPSPIKKIEFFDEIITKEVTSEMKIDEVADEKNNKIWKLIKNLIVVSLIILLFLIWYSDYYMPNHSDSDGDGVIDTNDQCPFVAGEQSNGCPYDDNFQTEKKSGKKEHRISSRKKVGNKIPNNDSSLEKLGTDLVADSILSKP